MTYPHAVVWMDHRTARVVFLSHDDHQLIEISSQSDDRRLHRKSGVPGPGHAADDVEFFDDLAMALAPATDVFLVGPGTAKKAFETHLQRRHPDLWQRVVGVEALDHPTDGELVAYARKVGARRANLG